MPSEKVLKEKQDVVEAIKAKLQGSVAGVIVDYKGINVLEDTKLRRELREANIDYTVVKNTLLRFAAKETGFDALTDVLEGTTAIAVSHDDPVAAAKILNKYAEASKGKFSLKAGYVEGKILDKAGVEQLAKLPSKEQLLVQLLSDLNGNIRGLAVALNAIAEKNSEEVVA
ncbi:MAG: 50S ribosomal protein L10 [Oscillospiraceae bacterium]